VNDLEHRLTAALNAVAEEAQIDQDAWQQNEDRLHHRSRAKTRRYVAASAIGLAAASVVAVVAMALWPHSHGTANPANLIPTSSKSPGTPTPSQTSSPRPSESPAATGSSPSRTTGTAAAQNLPIPNDVRSQLLSAFVAAKKVQASEIAGPTPGSVYYGYLPATDTYWAVADFSLSPTASQQTQINFQDGGSRGMFHRRAGEAWQVTIGEIPWPCPGDLPDAMLSVWHLSISAGCVVVNTPFPDRSKRNFVTLPDGDYFGTIEWLEYTYADGGSLDFDPYTWANGSGPVDNQPDAWSSLQVDTHTVTRYGDGTHEGVTNGVFDAAFGQRVASSMPQFVGHPTDGYIVSVRSQRVTSVTQVGPLNPMPASHPSYAEPPG
jgi:hypothetical protein